MAKNTTTYKKMSKREQRKHNAQFREVWDVCPLTRVVTNKKHTAAASQNAPSPLTERSCYGQ